MPTLRLHKQIYSEGSVSSAVDTFSEHASVEMTADDNHWVVSVEDEDADHATLVTRELANMALGLSIDSGATAG
jgi:hypothetical protein